MTATELRVWAEAHAPKEGAPGSPLASAVLRLLRENVERRERVFDLESSLKLAHDVGIEDVNRIGKLTQEIQRLRAEIQQLLHKLTPERTDAQPV